MANNIKNLRKLYDYTQTTSQELIDNDNKEILKRNKAQETKDGKLKKLIEFKVGLGFLENFKIILDTREENHRNLFILMIFILWIEYLLSGLIVKKC
jgi:hypothetical protein